MLILDLCREHIQVVNINVYVNILVNSMLLLMLILDLCSEHNSIVWVGDITRLKPDAWNKIKKTIEAKSFLEIKDVLKVLYY